MNAFGPFNVTRSIFSNNNYTYFHSIFNVLSTLVDRPTMDKEDSADLQELARSKPKKSFKRT